MSDELTPITRKETFLAKAGGQNVVTPTPITREETFLQAIIDNGSGGGGGGGGTGVLLVDVTADEDTYTMGKTFSEIFAAASSGSFVYFKFESEDTGRTYFWTLSSIAESRNGDGGVISVFDASITDNIQFLAFTDDAYPTAGI